MKEKLEAFRALVEAQQKERLLKDGYPESMKAQHVVTIKPAAKYTKVDIGSSGRFMVVNDTGEIFGIKAYGVIHRGHPYGTLDTIRQWYWGDYHPVRVRNPKIVQRRTSERTGDAVWMKFECGAGSRFTSTTEDWDGCICNYSGCECGTVVRKVGETDNRNDEWFGLHAAKKARVHDLCEQDRKEQVV